MSNIVLSVELNSDEDLEFFAESVRENMEYFKRKALEYKESSSDMDKWRFNKYMSLTRSYGAAYTASIKSLLEYPHAVK